MSPWPAWQGRSSATLGRALKQLSDASAQVVHPRQTLRTRLLFALRPRREVPFKTPQRALGSNGVMGCRGGWPVSFCDWTQPFSWRAPRSEDIILIGLRTARLSIGAEWHDQQYECSERDEPSSACDGRDVLREAVEADEMAWRRLCTQTIWDDAGATSDR